MKKFFWSITTLLFAVFFLTGCTAINQLLHPTPAPPPYSENDTWAIEVLSIKKYKEPAEFNCTNCVKNEQNPGVNLPNKSWFIDVTVKIVNKSTETKEVDEITVGLMVDPAFYGCGGVTVAGTDFCLPSGMIRDGQNYVNYGIDIPVFQEQLSFAPSSPDGEIVDFIFIMRSYAKYTDFYFDNISPLVIRKVKAATN